MNAYTEYCAICKVNSDGHGFTVRQEHQNWIIIHLLWHLVDKS